MSSVGLFYIIIIALFAVPLLAAFVVVLIQGVFDFRYIILAVGLIVTGVAFYFTLRFFIRLILNIRRGSAMAVNHARERARRGESVQLELLGGLLKLSYGGKNDPDSLPHYKQEPLLIEDLRENRQSQTDPVEKLKELSELKNKGIIEEDEFLLLKKKLIRGFCDAGRK